MQGRPTCLPVMRSLPQLSCSTTYYVFNKAKELAKERREIPGCGIAQLSVPAAQRSLPPVAGLAGCPLRGCLKWPWPAQGAPAVGPGLGSAPPQRPSPPPDRTRLDSWPRHSPGTDQAPSPTRKLPSGSRTRASRYHLGISGGPLDWGNCRSLSSLPPTAATATARSHGVPQGHLRQA